MVSAASCTSGDSDDARTAAATETQQHESSLPACREEAEEDGSGGDEEGDDVPLSARDVEAAAFEAHLFSKEKHDVLRASRLELVQLKEAQRLQEENEMRSKTEEPRKVILSKSSLRAVEGGACDFYTVRLSHPPEADVMVQIEDASGQVRASPKVVRFSFDATEPGMPGHWATPQKVRVMAVDDDSIEAMRETASLEHCALSGDLRFSSVNGRCLIEPSHLPVDIVDNDGGFVFSFGEVNGVRSHHPVAQSLRSSDVERRMSNSSPAVNLALRSSHHSHTSSLRERGPLSSTSESSRIPEMSVRSVGCGRSHMAVVLADGRVFTAGAGAQGQLGHGDFLQRVELTPWRSIDRDGILRSKITQVACGAAHTALVTDDGRLLMCGSNQEGQLGLCDGLDAGCAECRHIRESSRGGNDSRAQGRGAGARSSPTSAVAPPPSKWAAASQSPTRPQARPQAIHRSGKRGQVGCSRARQTRPLESSAACAVPRVVESLAHLFVERVACGDNHTVVLASTGSSNTDRGVVKCRIFGWGDSSSGALGCGISGQVRHPMELRDLDAEDPFQISCGSRHTAVLCGEGRLYTSGWGIHGCMGRRRAEDDEDLNYFDLVVTAARRGVQSPTFVEIASGHSHLAALADTNEVYICGENECGQLGVGDRIHRSLLTHVGFLSGLGVASLACGMFHTAAITWEGSLYVWGSNDNGQLGLGAHVLHQTVPALHGTVTGEVKQVHAGHAHTVVVMHKGLENPSPVRARLQKQHEARLRSFWAVKRSNDREKQARHLAQNPGERLRAQRRQKAESQRRREHKLRLVQAEQAAAEKLAEASRLPYAMVTHFTPRILTRKGRAASSIAQDPPCRGPALPAQTTRTPCAGTGRGGQVVPCSSNGSSSSSKEHQRKPPGPAAMYGFCENDEEHRPSRDTKKKKTTVTTKNANTLDNQKKMKKKQKKKKQKKKKDPQSSTMVAGGDGETRNETHTDNALDLLPETTLA